MMEIEKIQDDAYFRDMYDRHSNMVKAFRRYMELGDNEPITEELMDRCPSHICYLSNAYGIPSVGTTKEVLTGDFSKFPKEYRDYRELIGE